MTRQLEIERILDGFLADGADQLADHVLDAALGDIKTTSQRRSWWPPRRFAEMNNTVRIAIAAAAVVVVAIIGFQFLPPDPGVGGLATPTPSPTAAPMPASGPITAGTYVMGVAPRYLITVPQGWEISGLTLRKNNDQPNELAFDAYSAAVRVFADACQSEGTAELIGSTTEDLIAALAAQENSVLADPVDITIGGVPGKRLELSVPTGLDVSECSIGSLQTWVDAGGTSFFAGLVPGAVATVYVADFPGGRLLFTPHHAPDATAADIAELDAVVASVRTAP